MNFIFLFIKIWNRLTYKIHFFFKPYGIIIFTPKMSLNNMGNKLEKYLNYKNGFFIEAGGNDGILQSNTYYLEFKKKWKGILVEAIPDLYLKCKTNRKNADVYNFALVSPDYSRPTLRLHYAGLMSIAENSKSPDQLIKHVKEGLKFCRTTYEVDVPVATLESILDQNPPIKIDFLSLDVEGVELEVLKGLNLNKYRPKFILVEADSPNELMAFFLKNGYMHVEKFSFHDYLFKDKLSHEQ